MKSILCLILLFGLTFHTPVAKAMTAAALSSALDAAIVANGNADVPMLMQVTAAHLAGDSLSSVTSVTYVGPTIVVGPGPQTVVTAAVVNILLP